MRQKPTYENVGLGSKLIFPGLSVENGVDQYTVYTVEPGVKEELGRMIPTMFIYGTGRTFNDKKKDICFEVPVKRFQEFLFKMIWYEVGEVVDFYTDGQQN